MTPKPKLLKHVLASPLHLICLLNPTASQRLLGDFHARKQLQHENLLSLLGFSYQFGLLPAMVSPWIHNGSLTTHLEHNFAELTIEPKIRILRQVAAAISYLHSKGVVHGDLTATTGSSQCVLSSRGLHISEVTVRWAAPELFEVPENEESLSPPKPASDIYSFGCIMLQVMTGRPPYAEVRSDHQVTVLILKGKKPYKTIESPRRRFFLGFHREMLERYRTSPLCR
ncbi:kinase-like domain-containing protein [Suillus lakei]|nr:kinase-like domain-containing protein [Suillus lakei]